MESESVMIFYAAAAAAVVVAAAAHQAHTHLYKALMGVEHVAKAVSFRLPTIKRRPHE